MLTSTINAHNLATHLKHTPFARTITLPTVWQAKTFWKCVDLKKKYVNRQLCHRLISVFSSLKHERYFGAVELLNQKRPTTHFPHFSGISTNTISTRTFFLMPCVALTIPSGYIELESLHVILHSWYYKLEHCYPMSGRDYREKQRERKILTLLGQTNYSGSLF